MIVTNDISLRAVEPSDVQTMYQWENQMELWTVGNTLTPFSKAVLEKYVKHATLDIYQTKQLRLMIDARENESMVTIGMIDLFDFDPYHSRAGVGILINQKHRNKGYAGIALTLFIDYCFSHLGLHQLYCHINADNEPSQRLFESHGFVQTGIRKDWRKIKNGYIDELVYQRINQ
ncbi:diamine N-acetyltransferase [Breznakibacter xylanolyticus]|uniref:Diamine N-acetyltransferase n=1 Tax=Breznakibacter xylanolyticus TaxID=990 RepID=A0A2W7NMA9_9BACT|nr:GNAT family protein [Breznakibacter xylanolyticus]PZX20703.1 diamine N-acetyltransferase [Breznakibacter xylanolyticus]